MDKKELLTRNMKEIVRLQRTLTNFITLDRETLHQFNPYDYSNPISIPLALRFKGI